MKKEKVLGIPDDLIINKIYYLRGHKVMLDSDLSDLYKVETRRLNEQVKRNIKRFPEDFMFQLTQKELKILMSQNATSSWGGSRKLPSLFTEHGVLMLSSVLNSDRAIQANIQIMRIFTRIRKVLAGNAELNLSLEKLEKKTDSNAKNIEVVFQYLNELREEKAKPRKKIGFKIPRTKK